MNQNLMERVILLLVQPDLEQEKRITDSLLRVSGHEQEIYHLEC